MNNLVLIGAIGKNNELGKDNHLIWNNIHLHNNQDFERFLSCCECRYFTQINGDKCRTLSLSLRKKEDNLESSNDKYTWHFDFLTNHIANYAFLVKNTICENQEK